MGTPQGHGHSQEFGGVTPEAPKRCNYLFPYKSNAILSLRKFQVLLPAPLPPTPHCSVTLKQRKIRNFHQGVFTGRFQKGGCKSRAEHREQEFASFLPNRFHAGSSALLSRAKAISGLQRAPRKATSTKISACFRPPTRVVLSSRT